MEERYSRNRIYVSKNEQLLIKNTTILLGGAGIGSIIAECALRFGFENIRIVDGDKVEISNLNRQNYTEADLGQYKAECLSKRLLSINPQAKISFHNFFINENNVENLVENHNIAINALDFNSDIPFVFDNLCKKYNIPVLHPYNFGWAGFLTVINPQGPSLEQLTTNPEGFELQMAEHVLKYGSPKNKQKNWLKQAITEYKNETNRLSPPQLSIGAWITAGLCVNVLYNLATNKNIDFFPQFYLSSIHCTYHNNL